MNRLSLINSAPLRLKFANSHGIDVLHFIRQCFEVAPLVERNEYWNDLLEVRLSRYDGTTTRRNFLDDSSDLVARCLMGFEWFLPNTVFWTTALNLYKNQYSAYLQILVTRWPTHCVMPESAVGNPIGYLNELLREYEPINDVIFVQQNSVAILPPFFAVCPRNCRYRAAGMAGENRKLSADRNHPLQVKCVCLCLWLNQSIDALINVDSVN